MKKKRFKIDKMPTREPDFRIRYNRWFKPPYTLIVWDVKNKKEYCTNHFDFDNCVLQMKYKNSITSVGSFINSILLGICGSSALGIVTGLLLVSSLVLLCIYAMSI